MPVIVGVDPGISTTGCGVIRSAGGKLSALAFQAFTPPREQSFELRLRHIYRSFIAILEEHRPDAVAVEDTFYHRNVRSAFKLAQVRGIILLGAAEMDIPVSEYTPLAVKQAVVGYGRADKTQVQKMIQMMLGLDAPPKPLDVSDALALAVTHANTSATLERFGAGSVSLRRGRRR